MEMDFQDLYDSYSKDVYRFALWLSGDRAKAEDLTSETFIRAWTRRDAIRTETLKAYLISIARNLYLMQIRKESRVTDLEDIHSDPSPGPDRVTESRHELSRIEEILQSMRECDRTAFVLRVKHELPYADIARILGLSLASAKVKVHRVRKRLLTDRMEKEVS
jgi:RNA polymerase sigma-70 factor (ECF subfamily)